VSSVSICFAFPLIFWCDANPTCSDFALTNLSLNFKLTLTIIILRERDNRSELGRFMSWRPGLEKYSKPHFARWPNLWQRWLNNESVAVVSSWSLTVSTDVFWCGVIWCGVKSTVISFRMPRGSGLRIFKLQSAGPEFLWLMRSVTIEEFWTQRNRDVSYGNRQSLIWRRSLNQQHVQRCSLRRMIYV